MVKYAVITGASKGIGFATAVALAKENFNLIICARTSTDLKLAVEKIQIENPKITIDAYIVDVSKPPQLESFVEKIKNRTSYIDVLVNNAGLFIPGNITDEPEGALEEMMLINVYSVYHLTRGLLPLIKNAKRGHIFNLGSVAGTRANKNGGSYSISKFSLHGFSQNLR